MLLLIDIDLSSRENSVTYYETVNDVCFQLKS